ncbi:MAG: hypothetical protein JOS17DRAFT_758475 [Linnemannia elongata]|nr:MAG: hypothetical protein JOS17DRAFT_758475 [Linnemannia elongata]
MYVQEHGVWCELWLLLFFSARPRFASECVQPAQCVISTPFFPFCRSRQTRKKEAVMRISINISLPPPSSLSLLATCRLCDTSKRTTKKIKKINSDEHSVHIQTRGSRRYA